MVSITKEYDSAKLADRIVANQKLELGGARGVGVQNVQFRGLECLVTIEATYVLPTTELLSMLDAMDNR